MKRTKTLAAATVAACLIALACHTLSHPVAAAAAAKPAADGVLLESMDAELHRAMSSLGSATDTAQPKPYFISYAVSDADSISIGSQYGAPSHPPLSSRRRMADVQVRIGSPAEDNTHGDHRNSALTQASRSPSPTTAPPSPAASGTPPTAATAAPSTATSRSKPSSRSAPRKRTSPATSAPSPPSPAAPPPFFPHRPRSTSTAPPGRPVSARSPTSSSSSPTSSSTPSA